MTTDQKYFYGTGRRKTSVARVRVYLDKGPIIINGNPMEEVFPWGEWQNTITEPLRVAHGKGDFRVVSKVSGGGKSSQAGAIRHGISKALCLYDNTLRPPLKKIGFLTRDPRVVERKKSGLAKARRSYQFSKR